MRYLHFYAITSLPKTKEPIIWKTKQSPCSEMIDKSVKTYVIQNILNELKYDNVIILNCLYRNEHAKRILCWWFLKKKMW